MCMRQPFYFQERYTPEWLAGQVDLTKLPKMFRKLNETEKESVGQWVKLSMFADCVKEKFMAACAVSV